MKLYAHQRPRFDSLDLELLERATQEDTANLRNAASRTAGSALDLATAAMYNRLMRKPGNRAFMASVCEGAELPSQDEIVFGLIPGAFYREYKTTGADGARVSEILRELGLRFEVIPVHSFGRIEENARIINHWLDTQQTGRVALISLSKGSADCKTALRLSTGRTWDRVVAWISLSGLVQGTPLISRLRQRPLHLMGVHLLLWLRGQSFAAADDLRHGPGAPLTSWSELPANLEIVHVVGFPLRRHLRHPWAFRGYERLSALGPNDGGGILLEDMARLPGIVCPIWGADHYLQPDWDCTPLLRNIMLTAVTTRPAQPQASLSAATPSAAPAARSMK